MKAERLNIRWRVRWRPFFKKSLGPQTPTHNKTDKAPEASSLLPQSAHPGTTSTSLPLAPRKNHINSSYPLS